MLLDGAEHKIPKILRTFQGFQFASQTIKPKRKNDLTYLIETCVKTYMETQK